MWNTDRFKAFAGIAFVAMAIAPSATAPAFAAGYGSASPGDIALARKCESLPQRDAMHSKRCMVLGNNDPELFSPAYRNRMNLGENSAPANFAAPPPGQCTHADHAHGRNGC